MIGDKAEAPMKNERKGTDNCLIDIALCKVLIGIMDMKSALP